MFLGTTHNCYRAKNYFPGRIQTILTPKIIFEAESNRF